MTLILKNGATSSNTGGTDKTFTAYASDVKTVKLADFTAEALARDKLSVVQQEATKNSGNPGGYNHRRTVITMSRPNILADGTLDYDSLQFSGSFNIETTQAEAAALVEQFISGLVTSGSLSTLVKTGQQVS
jgi:hypothetical protein